MHCNLEPESQHVQKKKTRVCKAFLGSKEGHFDEIIPQSQEKFKIGMHLTHT